MTEEEKIAIEYSHISQKKYENYNEGRIDVITDGGILNNMASGLSIWISPSGFQFIGISHGIIDDAVTELLSFNSEFNIVTNEDYYLLSVGWIRLHSDSIELKSYPTNNQIAILLSYLRILKKTGRNLYINFDSYSRTDNRTVPNDLLNFELVRNILFSRFKGGLDENRLRRIIKENIRKVLNENKKIAPRK